MELNFVISVLDRDRADSMTSLYQDAGLPMILTFLGHGTAKGKHLALYGLEATEKAIVAAVADGEKTKQLIKNAKRKELDLSIMSDKELRDQINRAFLEKQYNDMFNPPQVSKGREYASRILETSGEVLAVAGSALAVALSIKALRGG